MDRRRLLMVVPLLLAAVAVLASAVPALGGGGSGMNAVAGKPQPKLTREADLTQRLERRTTNAERDAAAARLAAAKKKDLLGGLRAGIQGLLAPSALDPGGVPDYFGGVPNYATSQLPEYGPGIRKFVDSLPGLTAANANNLGQFIPVAVPDTTSFPGSDYYVIAVVQYQEKMHSDVPTTTLRGYMQLTSAGATLTPPSYLGPTIIAQKDRAVRVKFVNKLPVGTGGDLFLPVDTTVMGAGMGPTGANYKQNRATLHLHGGFSPWISDGTPHQWTTPANETLPNPYPKGVSVYNVPDMPDPGPGAMTFFYTNQQSARLLFYHDHSYGITRLNVYAGEAAPYLIQDPIENALVNGGSFKNAAGTTVTVPASTIPTEQIPLVIQDKTFVPNDAQLAVQDPTWDKAKYGGEGSLWLPHVYMPNQNPWDVNGVNAAGRWDYNPWFWPPMLGQVHPPVPNPLYGQPGQPPLNPGTPNPTIIPEAFMDTPVVNGTAYPFVKVGPKAYRFRILNASNDRYLNLQLYYAKSNTPDTTDSVTGLPTLQTDSGEVPMVEAAVTSGYPALWPVDGRAGGVPDPAAAGPKWIQIGNEGGFLPAPAVIDQQPVGYEYFRRTIMVLSVRDKSLYLGPAERADVVIDFSQVPAGTKLIMYNDAPAPMPAFDTRSDFYTGNPDQSDGGGAPSTQPGYGPNTRTIMQFQVEGATAAPEFDLPNLETALSAAFGADQPKPIVPQAAYGPAYSKVLPNNFAKVIDTTMTFLPDDGSVATVSIGMKDLAIIEGMDMDYGRMNAQLGRTLPDMGLAFGAAIAYNYIDAPTEILRTTPTGVKIGQLNDGTQIWRVAHMGVDTHAIHFHLFDIQVINRIAIDGQVFMPDANELGWKETVRMNPGQDIIIALRPKTPTLPFKVGDSVRLNNPAATAGATWTVGNAPLAPIGLGMLPTPVTTNTVTNFGWEYVWHCHLLGHEENDMMRPIVYQVSPKAPTALTATSLVGQVRLNWSNVATLPAATNYYVQRATNTAFTSGVTTFTLPGTPVTYLNTPVAAGTYYYRVRAENDISFSGWTNTVTATVGGASSLTILATPSSVTLPTPFILTGHLAPPGAVGSLVAVYVMRPGRTYWSYSSNRGLDAASNWWYRYTPTLRGTYRFYAQRGTLRSAIISVIVR